MIVYSSLLSSSVSINITCSSRKTQPTVATTSRQFLIKSRNDQLCSCGRRHLIEAAAATALLPIKPSSSSELPSDYKDMLKRVHPPRPDWYEEFYASVLNTYMENYESEIAGYKSQLFGKLRGKAKKVLEIGIGTGPNLKYYVRDNDIQVVGVDPNKKMEKYAQAAAMAAGLPLANFKFLQAVGEAIPLSDGSVDAVVGTLVLCSVRDVGMTLQEIKRVLKPGGVYLFVEHVAAQDGTLLKFWQNVLNPIQQTVADGCHLTRETGKDISKAGFSGVEYDMAFLSNAAFINPQVYGMAYGTLLKFWQSVLDPIRQIVSVRYHLTRDTGKEISEAGFSGLELGTTLLSNASLINPHLHGIACRITGKDKRSISRLWLI